jgi:hypothetical protein
MPQSQTNGGEHNEKGYLFPHRGNQREVYLSRSVRQRKRSLRNLLLPAEDAEESEAAHQEVTHHIVAPSPHRTHGVKPRSRGSNILGKEFAKTS